MYSEFLTSSISNLLSSYLKNKDNKNAITADVNQKIKAYLGSMSAIAYAKTAAPVLQRREAVIIIPLVIISGTGNVSSTANTYETLVIGTIEAPKTIIAKL